MNTSLKERVVFVLRRVDADGTEWAWVDDPDAKEGKSWKHLDKKQASSLDTDEELLPLLHLAIELSMEIQLFELTMLVGLLAFIDPSHAQALGLRFRSGRRQ